MEEIPSEIASDVTCSRCGGEERVRYCLIGADNTVVPLCHLCLYDIHDEDCCS